MFIWGGNRRIEAGVCGGGEYKEGIKRGYKAKPSQCNLQKKKNEKKSSKQY